MLPQQTIEHCTYKSNQIKSNQINLFHKRVHPNWDMTTKFTKYSTLYFYIKINEQ